MEKELYQDILMKKISNFKIKCRKIGIPLSLIIEIENTFKEFDGKVYIIGGNVRDLILNENSKTHPDLVVNLDIKKLVYCLNKNNIKFLKIGEQFGSLVVFIKKYKFDLTSMRRDVKTDGRWAKVEFTDNLVYDSKRRDFTFNSIYCDTKGNLYDPNNGIDDLINRRVRFIGNTKQRIEEDYLRILRFFRFSILISQKFEVKDYQICCENFNKIKSLSYERRMQEMRKIILSNLIKTKKTLPFIKKLIEKTLESRLNFKNFEELCILELSQKNISFQRRIKFLLRGKESSTDFIVKNAENSFKKRLLNKAEFTNYSFEELNLNLFRFNKDDIIDQLFFDCSDKKISEKKFVKFYNLSQAFKRKRIPINGDDLLKIGFEPGKVMGNALNKLELLWVEKNFKCTRKECIKFVEKFLP